MRNWSKLTNNIGKVVIIYSTMSIKEHIRTSGEYHFNYLQDWRQQLAGSIKNAPMLDNETTRVNNESRQV